MGRKLAEVGNKNIYEEYMKSQCIICMEWFDESEMVGEYCQDCYIVAVEDEEEF